MAELLALSLIRDVPDFPKQGLLFKDITPILMHPPAFAEVVDEMAALAAAQKPEVIVGIESRGFLFGVPVAMKLGLPFSLARKAGKLPAERIREEYALEYGTNTVEMHTDAIAAGHRVYVIDDLLATGGTAAATAKLIQRLGGEVAGFGFLIELGFLDGRTALAGLHVDALLTY